MAKVSFSFLSYSALMWAVFMTTAAIPVAASVVVSNTATELTVQTASYDLSILHDGFAVTLRRGNEVLLESATKEDAFPNLGFSAAGAQQRLTKLRSFQKSKGVVWLEYETSLAGVTARVEIHAEERRLRVRTWLLNADTSYSPTFRYKLSTGAWYGGGFQGYRERQSFPLNRANITSRLFFAQGASQGTPLWYSTRGVAVWIKTPHDFIYSIAVPAGQSDALLTVEMPGVSSLAYDILIAPDVREVLRRVNREIGFARSVPPADYLRLPIYTTWVEFKTGVSQQKVVDFAREVRRNKLPAGVIEIDDKWEDGYGSLRFDSSKFPSPKLMNDELHRFGFRVTLWVHPFVNVSTASFDDPAMRKLLLKDLSGSPGLIHWWQGDAAVWDFTNPAAAAAFRRRLRQLQSTYGFDGFKFDGGDVNLVPIDMVPFQPVTSAEFPDFYDRETAAHFPWSEARVGIYSQPLGIVQRLIDKNSVWGAENGLAAVLPEALITSMRGFVYVMPDMVGGNQYDSDKIDGELLVRWAQASALMPLLQFSLGPWHFDEETTRLCREASELHVKFSPYIQKLAAAVPKTGEPILRPLWYNFPMERGAEAVMDEFMVGDALLVAPVVAQGQVHRDIYLPEGEWRDYKTDKIMEGGRWVRDYAAPRDTLPLFVNVKAAIGLTGVLPDRQETR
jgi:alpha-glucosidase (family GH31 glycosyl hydrolase)